MKVLQFICSNINLYSHLNRLSWLTTIGGGLGL